MRSTVYLNKDQLIKLAGIAGTSDHETIGVSQEIAENGVPVSQACLVTSTREKKQRAAIVTSVGTEQAL